MVIRSTDDYCTGGMMTVSGWGYQYKRHSDGDSLLIVLVFQIICVVLFAVKVDKRDLYDNTTLRCVNLLLIENERCNRLLESRYSVQSNQFCLMNKRGGEDACQVHNSSDPKQIFLDLMT